jgi:hypothetical protein
VACRLRSTTTAMTRRSRLRCRRFARPRRRTQSTGSMPTQKARAQGSRCDIVPRMSLRRERQLWGVERNTSIFAVRMPPGRSAVKDKDRWISALIGLLIQSFERGLGPNCCSRTEQNSLRRVQPISTCEADMPRQTRFAARSAAHDAMVPRGYAWTCTIRWQSCKVVDSQHLGGL